MELYHEWKKFLYMVSDNVVRKVNEKEINAYQIYKYYEGHV